MIKVDYKLKELREESKLTQEQVAGILKVSRIVYNRYENCTRTIPIEALWALADYYKVSIDYLVGRED